VLGAWALSLRRPSTSAKHCLRGYRHGKVTTRKATTMADPRLVAMLASQGPKALQNPVTRFALGLPIGNQGVIPQPQPQPQPQPSSEKTAQGKNNSGIQEKLLARIRTVAETGFAVPGPGILPGYALRPEVRAAFDEMGGVSGFDATKLSPDEEKGLALIIDPNWVRERRQ